MGRNEFAIHYIIYKYAIPVWHSHTQTSLCFVEFGALICRIVHRREEIFDQVLPISAYSYST